MLKYSQIIRFTIPSVAMMIFTSIYGVIDGLFVSNFVGKTPFAAVNFIMPFIMILGAFGFMFGTDGIWISIIVAELMAAILTAVFIVALRKKYKY